MRKKLAAVYPYCKADGKLVFEKLRYEPKDFAYRRPNGRMGLGGGRLPKLLYRLPELLAADQASPIWIAEGEKDVDRLRSLGLVATCNPDGGGKGKWSPVYARYFRGRSVIILADNDWIGIQHAYDVASKLQRVTASLRILTLPGVLQKGDVSDWLDRGGTVEALNQLVHDSPDPGRAMAMGKIEVREPPRDMSIIRQPLAWHIEQVLKTDLTAQEKLLLIALNAITQPRLTIVATAISLSLPRVKAILRDLRRQGVVQRIKDGRTATYIYLRHVAQKVSCTTPIRR